MMGGTMGMITQILHENWRLQMPAGRGGPGPSRRFGVADLLGGGENGGPLLPGQRGCGLGPDGEGLSLRGLLCSRGRYFELPHQVLRFEGVDTVADIRLNGVLLAHVENMHRTFQFEVGGILKPGENWLEVKLYSPTKWIREHYRQNPAEGSSDAMKGFANLRKAHCMFGWDWAPTFRTRACGGRFPCWE